MRKFTFALPLAIAAIAVAAPAHAEEASSKTKEFIEKAAIGGLYEIETSRAAQAQATSPDVKKFAEMMITDHGKANAGLKASVSRSGLTNPALPLTLDSDHADKVAALKKKAANDFDEAYIDEQEDAHEDAVALFKSYSEDGDNPELKKYAAETLPKLEGHLKQVKTLDEAIN